MTAIIENGISPIISYPHIISTIHNLYIIKIIS